MRDGAPMVPRPTGNHRDYRQAKTETETEMEIVLVLLASLWIGALVVLLFVQADELRRVRTELAVERERNRRDYGRAF